MGREVILLQGFIAGLSEILLRNNTTVLAQIKPFMCSQIGIQGTVIVLIDVMISLEELRSKAYLES